MIHPKKSLGQNFLIDKNIIKKIINLTQIKDQNIIEIGPGLGALTDEIIKRKPNKLILIEKDTNICNLLINKFTKDNIKIINDDALKYEFNSFKNYKIISNLPYNISTQLIIKILKLNINIDELICMIQSELAEKFDYNKIKMNKYKFITQYCSKYSINFNVSKNVFFPKPKIKSKVVTFILNKKKINQEKIEYFMKYFFINKRKKINSNKKFKTFISGKYKDVRYEDLKYNEILKIYQTFKLPIR